MEQNYDILDKDVWAIKAAFEEWWLLLEGSNFPIQVLSDYKSLADPDCKSCKSIAILLWQVTLVDSRPKSWWQGVSGGWPSVLHKQLMSGPVTSAVRPKPAV